MKIKLGQFLLLIFIVVLLILGYFFFSSRQGLNVQSAYKKAKLIVGKTTFDVEISDTPELRSLGLSDRKNLQNNDGMLFLFPVEGFYSFWMKDMNFPLDFVWINGKKIIDLTENVPSSLSPEKLFTFTSHSPADKILEIHAGAIKKNDIQVGNLVNILFQ